jgi:hypothetical protein
MLISFVIVAAGDVGEWGVLITTPSLLMTLTPNGLDDDDVPTPSS